MELNSLIHGPQANADAETIAAWERYNEYTRKHWNDPPITLEEFAHTRRLLQEAYERILGPETING